MRNQIACLSLFFFLALAGCITSDQPQTPERDANITAVANATAWGRAFMHAYPDADATVDWSGRLAVDYWHFYGAQYGTNDSLRLRVFVDEKTMSATEAFAECRRGPIYYTVNYGVAEYILSHGCDGNPP